MPSQKINSQILAIAVPAIVSNITTPVLGLVDVAIMGHVGAAAYIGAIAVGSTMFNMLYWLFGFLRMGTAGLTSQACGAGNGHESSALLRRSLLLAFAIAAMLMVLSAPLGGAVLGFLDADEATAPLARRYFSIVIFGAPATLGLYALNGWMLGMQDSRTPMYVALLTNIVNIALSATFVFALGMKIEGVAAGTLIAQWTGLTAALVAVWRRYRPEAVALSELMTLQALSKLFKINFDIFLRTVCLVAVTAWFTRSGATQGVDILAANALLMQLFMFFSYFSDGFAFAGEALAGKHFGSGSHQVLRRTIRALLVWGAWIAVGFTVVYFLCGELILEILTDDDGVLVTAREYLPWAVSVPLCGILAFIYDGVSVGLTFTRQMLVSVASGMIVFFAMLYGLLPLMANHALWLAFMGYLLVRGLTLMAMTQRFVNRLK